MMLKKLCVVLTVALLAASSFGANLYFNGVGATGDLTSWEQLTNWRELASGVWVAPAGLPTLTDNVWVGYREDTPGIQIKNGIHAQASILYGCSGSSSARNYDLTIQAGGSLTIASMLYVNTLAGYTGIVSVEGLLEHTTSNNPVVVAFRGNGTMNVNGGTINARDLYIAGHTTTGAFTPVGNLNVNAGLVDLNRAGATGLITVAYVGTGHLTVNGGTVTARSIIAADNKTTAAGHIQLNGGTINLMGHPTNGWLQIDGWVTGATAKGGTVDITGGTLRMFGAESAFGFLNHYINGVGSLTGYGSPSNVRYEYDPSIGAMVIWASRPGQVPPQYGWANPDGQLNWQNALSGFDSYNVYLGRSFQDVYNAQTAPACGSILGDINGDCAVDIEDLERLGDCWLSPADCDPFADLDDSGTIRLDDFAKIASDWLISAPFLGNQTAASYSFAGLDVGKTYHWRVDGIKNSQITREIQSHFEVVPAWQLTGFVNSIGWPEVAQFPEATRAQYVQDLYDAGIRHVMDHGTTIPYYAAKGIKVYLYHAPTEYKTVAFQYRKNTSSVGYFQYDEPGQSNFPTVAQTHYEARVADPSRPSYTNLFSSDATPFLQGDSWIVNYVNAFISTVNPEILSYDHYPWRYNMTGSKGHWRNLQVFREKSLAAGIPLVCWSDVRKGSSYPGSATNKNRMRFSNYTRLAYGVKGLWWFGAGRMFDISTDAFGLRTYTKRSEYYDVAEVNAELNRVGAVMVPLTSTAVYHTNTPDSYTTLLPAGHWVQVAHSGDGFLLGMFKDADNKDYAMICNKSATATAAANVTFKDTMVTQVQVFNEQNGSWSSLTIGGSYPNLTVQVPLGIGYGKLLKIN